MGEAKIRRDALRRFEPLPEDLHVCPSCRGRRTVTEMAPPLALSHVPTLMAVCRDCKAVWECTTSAPASSVSPRAIFPPL